MKELIKKIITPVRLECRLAEILLLVPRIVCGLLLTLDFGSAKFGMPWSPPEKDLDWMEVAFWFPHDVAEYGGVFAQFPAFFAWMGAFSEAVGGVFLVLGLYTRPFAFLVFCTMSVAIFFQQWNAGTWNMLPALGFLWVSIYLLVLGSGRWGMDHGLPAIYEWLRSHRWGKPILWGLGLGTVAFLSIHAGVQDIKKQTLVIKARSIDNAQILTMGLRGSDKPLSWNKDIVMNAGVGDSVYTARVEIFTGYPYTELKLVRNGVIELEGQDNRTIRFDSDRITEVNLIFDQPQNQQ